MYKLHVVFLINIAKIYFLQRLHMCPSISVQIRRLSCKSANYEGGGYEGGGYEGGGYGGGGYEGGGYEGGGYKTGWLNLYSMLQCIYV